ncbi:MAG TPA: aldehyde dehydrogenase family protein, partial [Acinetobacter johnsonii]|nr:aldehyde dehydrogenase family protein [Acinetobacter johnsonii]
EQVQGIMFTGSTEVAKILQKTVAKRLSKNGESIPLIAETGGQNAMIVDSSALTEQVVLDVVSSAYDSAGQRCSALRVLCVQEDNADAVIQMLKGAMQQLQVGNPYLLKTDIGPVIDAEAQENIQKHIDKMRQKGHRVHQLMRNDAQDTEINAGTFITPTLIELPNLNDLEREVFGPVLHVIRFNQGSLKQLLEHINSKGYGLTMGLHTRIDETIQTVMTHAEVGNLYINRNIVGAVVGVQPFGGEGLSGTGPKAGGPIYLYRLMQNCSAKKLNKPFATGADLNPQVEFSNSALFLEWAAKTFPAVKLAKIENFCSGHHYELQGPTGESNQYMVIPRHAVLSLAEQEADQLQQLNAIFAVGSRPAVLADNSFVLKHMPSMPKALAQAFHVIKDIKTDVFDAVLHHGTTAQLLALQQQIAERQGAIVGITHLSPSQTAIPLERFVIERAISVNTAAAGGNASLMTLN